MTMKLITELREQNIEYLAEEKEDGTKSFYIRGPFMQAEIVNRNGRKYPIETMMNEVKRYNENYISKNRAFGELNHPPSPTINLDRVSHRIVELTQEGNDIIGKAKIMETPMGNIVKNLMNEGCSLGVSSRGMGSLKEVNGVNVVQDDFQLVTAADIVADPSAPAAFVEGIMEGVEWVMINNSWVPNFIDKAQQTIKESPKSKLQENIDKIYKEFFSKV